MSLYDDMKKAIDISKDTGWSRFHKIPVLDEAQVKKATEAINEAAVRLFQQKINQEELEVMKYSDYVYDIIKGECEGMDAIYEDYIIQLVGEYGLKALQEYELVEGCGVLNGRRLYVLCDKK